MIKRKLEGKNMLINIKKGFLAVIKRHFENNPIKFGGSGSVVQVYETMLNHNVRAHRGRSPNNKILAITMIDTSTTPVKGYAEVVLSRNSDTLLPIIQRAVADGSNIHTDEWPAYNRLSELGYNHYKITHKYNFIDPITGIHTQNVESFNNKSKMSIKMQRGCTNGKHQMLIDYFLFIDTYKAGAYLKFLELIKYF
ncbi:hypothetical protein DMUE_2748 [Dictyocoela muelleri]|nr:hypothetical protein DMUE_2748 [Dictyocoela muelleri]